MNLFDKLFKGRQVDKSLKEERPVIPTPVKGEIPEERKKQFTGIWDARRLLHELLRITQSVRSWKFELYKTDSDELLIKSGVKELSLQLMRSKVVKK